VGPPKDTFSWLTGYSGWAFYCALLSVFGSTGYYSDFLRNRIPDWAAVSLFIGPLLIIVFIQWGELPDRVVARCHIIAASWFALLAVGMEVGHFLGYSPKGSLLFRLLGHLGWTFAWAGIFRRAKTSIKGAKNGESSP
jgi:hypothetical protein